MVLLAAIRKVAKRGVGVTSSQKSVKRRENGGSSWNSTTPYGFSASLYKTVLSACHELIEEHARREDPALARTSRPGIACCFPRAPPPGNGKTTLAEAMASALMVPLIVARYDGLIGSYLGETASRLRRLFDFAPPPPMRAVLRRVRYAGQGTRRRSRDRRNQTQWSVRFSCKSTACPSMYS